MPPCRHTRVVVAPGSTLCIHCSKFILSTQLERFYTREGQFYVKRTHKRRESRSLARMLRQTGRAIFFLDIDNTILEATLVNKSSDFDASAVCTYEALSAVKTKILCAVEAVRSFIWTPDSPSTCTNVESALSGLTMLSSQPENADGMLSSDSPSECASHHAAADLYARRALLSDAADLDVIYSHVAAFLHSDELTLLSDEALHSSASRPQLTFPCRTANATPLTCQLYFISQVSFLNDVLSSDGLAGHQALQTSSLTDVRAASAAKETICTLIFLAFLHGSGTSEFYAPVLSVLIRIRPGLYQFLASLLPLVVVNLSTLGTSAYAETVSRLLDPFHVLFAHKYTRTDAARYGDLGDAVSVRSRLDGHLGEHATCGGSLVCTGASSAYNAYGGLSLDTCATHTATYKKIAAFLGHNSLLIRRSIVFDNSSSVWALSACTGGVLKSADYYAYSHAFAGALYGPSATSTALRESFLPEQCTTLADCAMPYRPEAYIASTGVYPMQLRSVLAAIRTAVTHDPDAIQLYLSDMVYAGILRDCVVFIPDLSQAARLTRNQDGYVTEASWCVEASDAQAVMQRDLRVSTLVRLGASVLSEVSDFGENPTHVLYSENSLTGVLLRYGDLIPSIVWSLALDAEGHGLDSVCEYDAFGDDVSAKKLRYFRTIHAYRDFMADCPLLVNTRWIFDSVFLLRRQRELAYILEFCLSALQIRKSQQTLVVS